MTGIPTCRPLLLLALLLSLARVVQPHAYLAYPPSRNYQSNYLIQDAGLKYYCPHCGQGGGSFHVPSMCGDPFQDVTDDPTFIPFTDRFYGYTELSQGQDIVVNITVSTNHGGRMSLSICPLPRKNVTQACFDRPEFKLRRVNADPKYNNKIYWYLNIDNNQSALETFRLPAGITCENGCMMQWWWLGYQSCTMPCEDPSIDVPGECNHNAVDPGVGPCTSILQTEQFYNCADIIIYSSPPPPTPAPPLPPGASPYPSPNPDKDCPLADWRCTACMAAAAKNPVATAGLISACFNASLGFEGYAAVDCMKELKDPGVVAGCMNCTTVGNPGWACFRWCGRNSTTGEQMAQCSSCLGAPGIDTWGCVNCLDMAGGNSTKSGQCMNCVKAGIDGWTCGQCLTKNTTAAVTSCFGCLKTAGVNTWPCIAPA